MKSLASLSILAIMLMVSSSIAQSQNIITPSSGLHIVMAGDTDYKVTLKINDNMQREFTFRNYHGTLGDGACAFLEIKSAGGESKTVRINDINGVFTASCSNADVNKGSAYKVVIGTDTFSITYNGGMIGTIYQRGDYSISYMPASATPTTSTTTTSTVSPSISQYTSCDTCVRNYPYGWCGTTGTSGQCFAGSDKGPSSGSCSSPYKWVWEMDSCGRILSSSTTTTSTSASAPRSNALFIECSACTEQGEYGWCGTQTSGDCVYAPKSETAPTSCPPPKQWVWKRTDCGVYRTSTTTTSSTTSSTSTSSTASSTASTSTTTSPYKSCGQCITYYPYGWCGASTTSGQCMVGSTSGSGPKDGSCSSPNKWVWTIGTCDSVFSGSGTSVTSTTSSSPASTTLVYVAIKDSSETPIEGAYFSTKNGNTQTTACITNAMGLCSAKLSRSDSVTFVASAKGYERQEKTGKLNSESTSFSFSLTKTASQPTQTTTTTPATYTKTFYQGGLPADTLWVVTITPSTGISVKYTSTTDSVLAGGLQGTVNYVYDDTFKVGTKTYTCSKTVGKCSGTFTSTSDNAAAYYELATTTSSTSTTTATTDCSARTSCPSCVIGNSLNPTKITCGWDKTVSSCKSGDATGPSDNRNVYGADKWAWLNSLCWITSKQDTIPSSTYIKANQPSYKAGDTISVSGNIGYAGSSFTILIINPIGNPGALAQGTSDSTGKYELSIATVGSPDNLFIGTLGRYNATITDFIGRKYATTFDVVPVS